MRSIAQSIRRGRQNRPRNRVRGEMLEERLLLAVDVRTTIDPATAQPIHLAPGTTTWQVASSEHESYYWFFARGSASSLEAAFQTASSSFGDAAIALYDADGNLIVSADQNASPTSHANEALTTQLDTMRPYILAIVSDPTQPAALVVQSHLAGAAFAAPIITDLQTGSAELGGDSGTTILTQSTDVSYHRLQIPNGAAHAVVTVTPGNIDLTPFVTVFERPAHDSAWRLIESATSTGANVPLAIELSAPSDQYLAQRDYFVAVSSAQPSQATGTYEVTVSSDTLAPATVPAPAAAAFQRLEPSRTATSSLVTSHSVAPGNPAILPITATHAGDIVVTVASESVVPLISVYDSTGSELQRVASSLAPPTQEAPLELTWPVAAGDSFVLRLGTAGSTGGSVEVGITSGFMADEVDLAPDLSFSESISLDAPYSNRFLRLPASNADLLTVEITPQGGDASPLLDPVVVLVDQNGQLPLTKSVHGNRIRYSADVSQISSDLDLVLSSETGLSPNVNLQLGYVHVPRDYSLYDPVGVELDLDGNAQTTVPSVVFGEPQGMAFFHPVSETLGQTTVTFVGEAHTVLAFYEEYGGRFQLLEWSQADSAGQVSMKRTLEHGRYAALAIPAGFSSSNLSNLEIDAPALTGVGVNMVPSDAPVFPSSIANQFAPNPNTGDFSDPAPAQTSWSSELNIRQVTLQSDYEQHLWRTILPLNILDVAGNGLQIELEPADLSGLTVDLLRASDQQLLTSLNSINGVPQTAFIPIGQVDAGETLLLRVRSLPDQREDGIYSLRMTVDTDNPHPYEVTERHWKFGAQDSLFAVDDPYSDVQQGATPIAVHAVGQPNDIPLSPWGNGAWTSEFLDDGGANNHVHAYRFRVPAFGQMKVWTEAIDAHVNTNLRLYKRITTGTGDFLTPLSLPSDVPGELVEVLPNFDWFPANRSVVDAQSYVHDLTDFIPPVDDTVYAIVKNQEASLGRYQIHVDVMGTTANIPVVALSPAAAGPTTTAWNLQDVESSRHSVHYAAVQLPDQHGGTVEISVPRGSGTYDVRMFNDQGQAIVRSRDGSFVVPEGPRTVYLRAQALSVPSTLREVTFDVSTTIAVRPGLLPLPARQPRGAIQPIDGNQFGDGTLTTSLSGVRTGKLYSLTAAPGPLRLQVEPHDGAAFRWAVYIDGALQAWDQTEFSDGQFTPQSLWTEIYVPGEGGRLPMFNQAIGADVHVSDALQYEHDQRLLWTRDVPFDGGVGTVSNHYRNVVIYVEPVRSGGPFTIAVDSGNTLPMRSSELTIDLRDGSISRLTEPATYYSNPLSTKHVIASDEVTGQQWTRFYLPYHATNTTLRVSAVDIAGLGSTFHYHVFDSAGELKLSGDGTIPILGGATFPIHLPNNLPQGRAYFVQVQPTTEGVESLRLRATASLPSNGVPDSLSEPTANPLFGSLALNPDGDATVSLPSLKSAFWVGAAGAVDVSATSGQSIDAIRIYRVERYVVNELLSRQDLVLVDFSDPPPRLAATTLELSTELDPGAYVLEVFGTGDSTINVAIDTPTPVVESITVDPNFGISSLPGLAIRDLDRMFGSEQFTFHSVQGGTPHNILPEYRQSLFAVQAAAGALGFGRADAVATDVGDSETFQKNDLAFFSWWRKNHTTDTFARTFTLLDSTLNPTRDNNGNLTVNEANVTASSGIAPHETLYVALNRANLNAPVSVTAAFPVPFSGTPDLVVLPIVLTPNNGETRVGVNVTNVGYAPAFPNVSLYSIKDDSQSNPLLKWVTSTMQTSTLGPFGASLRLLEWDPVTPQDEVRFDVDVNDSVEELDETNNMADEILSSVNRFAPEVLSFELADPNRDGMKGPLSDPQNNRWGRYIAGVAGTDAQMVFQVKDDDDLTPGKDDIYKSYIVNPNQVTIAFSSDHEQSHPFVPKNLQPTSGANPNEYILFTKDIWGLESERVVRIAEVVARPGWLTSTADGISTSLTFDKQTNAYKIQFENRLVDYNKTLNQMLGMTVPFVGNKENQFLVSVSTAASVSLDPTQDIFVPISAQAKLKILGNTVFDHTYDGNTPVTDHLALLANLDIDPRTVEATAFFVSFRMEDLPVLDYNSPEIRLFSYGVPGLASLNANLLIDVFADLDAGVSLAFDAAALADPLQLSPLGVARPTFVGLDLNPSLTIEGEAELFGFLDIASISGSIGLNLSINVGLDADGSDPTDIVPFDDFFSNLDIELSGNLTLATQASVLGIEVWDYEWQSPPLFSVGDVYTWDEYDQFVANNTAVPATFPNPDLMTNDANGNPVPVPPAPAVGTPASGSEPLRELQMRAQPQLVLDDDAGMFLQLVDVGNGRSNLAYSTRNQFTWDESLSVLLQPEHVSNPAVAMLPSQSTRRGLVTYQATALPNLFAPSVTFDTFANAQEIRYRYFDGQSWGAEQSLEANGRFDGNPAMAFNDQGHGVLAWTHNHDASPLRSPMTNDIHVSLWDDASNAWLPPTPLTFDPTGTLASDTRPAVFMGDDGMATVVWLRNAESTLMSPGTELWFSQHKNGSWSPPTQLDTRGIEGHRITQVAIDSAGKDANGRARLDVILAAVRYESNPPENTEATETTAVSRLLHRAAWADAFSQPTGVQVIHQHANYSYLDTLRTPDGLTVYWQQSDGNENELYVARTAAPISVASGWSVPVAISRGAALEIDPTIAFDHQAQEGDRLQVVFDQRMPLGSNLPVPEPSHLASDGIPLGGSLNAQRIQQLPEFAFAQPFRFEGVDKAPVGNHVLGKATIVNQGLARSPVLIELVRQEDNQTLANRQITLGPGSRFDLLEPVLVTAGKQTIEVRLTALTANGAEMLSVDNNTSHDTIIGLTDLTIDSVQLLSTPLPGATVPVAVTIRNNSAAPVNVPFTVDLHVGSSLVSTVHANAIATQTVMSLAANQAATYTLPWKIAEQGGLLDMTVMVDGAQSIEEAYERNNTHFTSVHLAPDVEVNRVTATLLDYSGQDNVAVTAEITNHGEVAASDATVQLWWSRNDGPFVQVSEQTVVEFLPGEQVTVPFIARGWAGTNSYRVTILPSSVPLDKYPANNFASERLALQGFADLVVDFVAITTDTPTQGEPVDVRITVRNQGIDDAQDVQLHLVAVSPVFGRRVVGTATIGRMSPFEIVTVLVPVDTTHLVGDIELRTIIDRHEKILEISDLNNQHSIDVTFAPARELPSCDLNRDGACNAADIDLLHAQIRAAIYQPELDVNADGLLDHEDAEMWIKDLMDTTPGDTNLDGVFDSSDLVLVFQAGRYEDPRNRSASFIQGDWNGDGVFNSTDLVFAFQGGGYDRIRPAIEAFWRRTRR